MYVHLCFEKYKLRTSSLVVNILVHVLYAINSKQNGRFFADEDLKCILLNENVGFLNKFSLKYVPYGLIVNMTALVKMVACRRIGNTPLWKPMLVYFSDAYMLHSTSTSWYTYK